VEVRDGFMVETTRAGHRWVPDTLPPDAGPIDLYVDGPTDGFVVTVLTKRGGVKCVTLDGERAGSEGELFRDDVRKPFGVKLHTLPEFQK
jgi:hypothetical protein